MQFPAIQLRDRLPKTTPATQGLVYESITPAISQTDVTETKPSAFEAAGLRSGTAKSQLNTQERKSDDEPLLVPNKPYGNASKYQRVTQDYWTYELIGLAICVGTLISIVATLYAFDGSPTPHVLAGVTLNTVISVLATLSRAAAVFVAASVIAQGKWRRFEQSSRPSSELSLYDDATRGPLGSLYLLGTFRVGIVTTLAALVAVLSLGFEPFVQQAVKYPLKDQLSSSSITATPSLPIVRNITLQSNPDVNKTLLMENAFSQALYAENVSSMTPICAGTSCDWPDYPTAGFCYSCEDALSEVIIEPRSDPTLLAWPRNDYLRDLQFTDLVMSSSELHGTWNTTYNISLGQGFPAIFNLSTESFLDIGLVSNRSMLTYPETIVWNLHGPPERGLATRAGWLEWTNTTINGVVGPLKAYGLINLTYSASEARLVANQAKRCVMSFCAKEMSDKFQNGSLSEKVTKTEWGVFAGNKSNGYTELYWSASLGGSSFHAGLFLGRNCTSQDCNLLNIYKPFNGLTGMIMRSVPALVYAPDAITYPSKDIVQFMSKFEQSCASIARTFSNTFQKYGDGNILGRVYLSKPFVEVRWAWLSFPAILIIAVCVALVTTILQTRNRHLPIWKNSPYPLLYNYPDRTDGQISKEGPELVVTTNSSHQKMAESTYLRLRWVSGSWKFERV